MLSRRYVPWFMVVPFFAQAQVVAAQSQAPTTAAEDETFARAVAAFEARDFTTALRLFQDAYIATRRPDVLRNVAVTFERLDRPSDAAAAYERYLTTATEVPDRGSVEQRIAALRADAERRALVAAVPVVAAVPAPVAASSPPPPAPRPASPAPEPVVVATPLHVPIPPLVVIGVGAVVLGSSGLFYGLRTDALSGCAHVGMQNVCPTDASFQHAQSAPTWNALTNVALIAGPLLMVAGGAWLAVDLLHSRRTAPPGVHAMVVVPSSGGLTLSAMGNF